VLYKPSTLVTNTAAVNAITFGVPSRGDRAVQYDFCVDQIEAVNGGACSAGNTGPVNTPTLAYNFDGATQGFALSTFTDVYNLATPGATSTPPTLGFDSLDGNPALGSLRVGATYTTYGQYADVIYSFASPLDLSGRLLRAKVKLDAGSYPGIIIFHASSSNYQAYATGTAISPAAGRWYDLFLDMRTVDDVGWDSTSVNQIGIEFTIPSAGAGPLAAPVSAGFHIDTVTN